MFKVLNFVTDISHVYTLVGVLFYLLSIYHETSPCFRVVSVQVGGPYHHTHMTE